MPTLTPAALRKSLKTGQLAPVYVLAGDDFQEKDSLLDALIECVDAELRAFNVERLQGEASVATVIDAVRTLPFAAPRRMVIVVGADPMLAPKRESEAAVRASEALEAYVKAPLDSATLVFVAETLDARRTIVKRLLETAVVVRCAAPEQEEAPAWVRGLFQAAGREIDRGAVALLVSNAGADTLRLRGDVDRLLLYAGDDRRIEVADVEAILGGAAAGGDWAVTEALESGRTDVALRELALLLDGGAETLMVLGQIGWWVRSRLPAARVPAAVDALMRADRDMKSSRDHRVVLERLIVEIGTRGGAAGEGRYAVKSW